jgi:polyisoprenyl-phosphate glycosyltransferase
MNRPLLSAIVICFRDGPTVRELHRRLTMSLRGITDQYEIIYVNDASPDDAADVLRELVSKDPHLTVIHHARNFGSHAAFTSGMQHARGDAVILMDGDLQDPPELIPEFVRLWREGFIVVYGIRRKRQKSMGIINRQLYHLFYIVLQWLSSVRVPLDAGEFSLMDRLVVDRINAMPERQRFVRGLRAWVGGKQTGVAYDRPERYAGVSTYGLRRNVRLAKQAICSFSDAPLVWVSYVAAAVTVLALLGILFYLWSFVVHPETPQGFTTIFVLVLFLGSIQLLSLSVIAEYIGRIFEETKGRPHAVIREIWNDQRSESNGSIDRRND